MTILTPERDGIINKSQGWLYSSKSFPTSRGMSGIHDSSLKRALLYPFPHAHPENTLHCKGTMPWEYLSFLSAKALRYHVQPLHERLMSV